MAANGFMLTGPVATVLAAILGALITGFGAATLRHRWDVRADERKWNRNRDQRIRAQFLEAFSQYLAARPDFRTIPTITANPEDAAAIVSQIQLAAASLLILLADAEHREVIETDLSALVHWITESLNEPSKADWTDVPSTTAIIDLARRLAVEPETNQPGGLRRIAMAIRPSRRASRIDESRSISGIEPDQTQARAAR